MKFRRVLQLQQCVNRGACVGQTVRLHVRKSEIIAVVVRAWIGALGFFEIGQGSGDLVGAHIKLAEIVIRIETARFEFHSLLEFFFREFKLAHSSIAGSEIGASRARIRFQADGTLQVGVGFIVAGFGGIHHSQQLLDFKAFRHLTLNFFQSSSGFGEFSGVVLGDRSLKLLIQLLRLLLINRQAWSAGEYAP